MVSGDSPMVSALFRMAITAGTPASVLLHIRRGANVNARDGAGATPLMLAVARGRAEICKLLLDEGADPRLTDKAGRTVLDYVPGQDGALAELLLPPSSPSQLPAPPENEPEAQPVAAESDGWEAEEEQQAPAEDEALRLTASQVQAEAAAHRAKSLDVEWSDVDFRLPVPVRRVERDPARQRERARLRRLFGQILETGVFTHADVAAALTRDQEAGRGEEADRRLYSVLVTAEALGAEPEAWTEWAGHFVPRRAPGEAADEALDLLEDLWSSESALETYYRDLSGRPVATRELEVSGWRRYEVASVELWRLLISEGRLIEALYGLLEDELRAAEQEASVGDGVEAEEGPSRAKLVTDAMMVLESARAQPAPDVARSAARAVARLRLPLRVIESLVASLTPSSADLSAAVKRARRARDRIAESNLKLVIWQARRSAAAIPLEDRIQEGNLGLLKAIERFDPHRGNRFTTYALWWIRQSISRAIQDHGRTIRVPVHIGEHVRRVARASNAFEAQNGRPPTVEELARETGSPTNAIARILRGLPEVEWVDTGPSADDARVLEVADSVPTPEQSVIAENMRSTITAALSRMPPREERVLRMRFGLGMATEMTLEEIGIPFEVTRERIRQIEHKALVRLAHPSRSRKLQSFVGA